ncbi:hypothetical protein HOD29_07345 [archaeon]|jgi:hypothetical protein|nr:hypothetical protein [archaeon]
MSLKSDYDKFVGKYVKVITPEGNFYGKLKDITDNNIVLNPHLDDSFDSEGIKNPLLMDRDLMYTRGAVRGISPRTEEEIKGLEKFAQKSMQEEGKK